MPCHIGTLFTSGFINVNHAIAAYVSIGIINQALRSLGAAQLVSFSTLVDYVHNPDVDTFIVDRVSLSDSPFQALFVFRSREWLDSL